VIRYPSNARSPDDLNERRESTLEQAALRRIATQVAQGTPPHELFAVVANEVGHLVGAPTVAVGRYESDDTVTVCGTFPEPGPLFRTGARVPLEAANVLGLIREYAEPARVDDYAELEGEIADAVRSSGLCSSVGVPIVVAGRVWGAIVASSSARLPEDTGARLAEFTELLAAAIANVEAREALARLADEQAALRRVATLVAKRAQTGELFGALVEEVARLLPVSTAAMGRYDPDGLVTTVAAWSEVEVALPIGRRWIPEGENVTALVFRTGAASRIDDFSEVSGPLGDRARPVGYRSAVGCPIMVEGRLWGVIATASVSEEPLPQDTEQRLEKFTELVTTAISNSEARAALLRLADEQAALRRVATLVAQGAAPAEVVAAVSAEVDRVFQLDPTTSDVAVVGRFDPGPELFVVGLSKSVNVLPLGSRWPADDLFAPTHVLRTGRSARIRADDVVSATGEVAQFLQQHGYLSQVASPIVVEGHLWGAMSVNSRNDFPPDTEERLERFTELVATAIANAESRDALGALADEQIALRRVATLVARDAPADEVFDAVAMEVGKLLDTDITVIGRYDNDGAATAIGSWSASQVAMPVGTRSVLGGRNVLTLVAETERPARIDGYDDSSGEAAEIARTHGWRSSIAAPIIVADRLWGVMLVATQRPEAFPAGAEERLAAFTDLVATALANAQAYDDIRWFGEEQAALGRVATLVAAGTEPQHVFAAVVEEASSLLGLERIEVVRYDGSHAWTVIAATGEHPFSPGSTWSFQHPSVMATVARTSRAASIDEYDVLKTEIARLIRSASFESVIGAPLTVEGRLWGVIIAVSTDPEPIPELSEARLGQFTELVATAVANAESRQALERVAAEQATLRRIATLVARGVQPEELFAAVAEETATTFDAITGIARFEHDPPGVVLVGVSKDAELPLGVRWDFAEGMSSAEVYRTGLSARFNPPPGHWSSLSGQPAEAGHRLGIVSQVSCPIIVEGAVWGVITVNAREDLPPDTEQRLEKFTDLVTTAIANAEGKSELAASRRRIVAAADEARRRIERDLHDGIQQRLIALAFRARSATRKPSDDLRGIATELAEGLNDVSDELREVSRGIHPTVLTEVGLGPALRALARRSTVPADVNVQLDERLPAPVEAAAYYIASEALTNVAKHAHASVVELVASYDDGMLTLEVRDDGIGGVDAGRGSGILGLTDRVEALGGTISISSPARGGTALMVHLPSTT
jgi:GAF domain-containing protein